jgi:hypothetical protein
MIGTIFFEVVSNRRDIEIEDSQLVLSETELKKIKGNVKKISLKGFESKLTVTSWLMDALEDAVSGSRVIPMNVTITELSTRVINGSKFDFWIIQGE